MASLAAKSLLRDATLARYVGCTARGLHSSAPRKAITKFMMPAMSPTMTEGGLATWKVKEGQNFSAGDVLLEIETDKATMDVEAQDDGIMAKIVVQEGAKSVPVGKIIAMLAEEGDDISNVEVPAEEDQPKQQEEKSASSSSSTSAPSTAPSAPKDDPQPKKTNQESPSGSPQHSSGQAPNLGHKLFPSVSRILVENNVSQQDAQKIKGTGLHGMITKGDVLAFIGKISNPNGSYRPHKGGVSTLGGGPAVAKKQPVEPLTDNDIRNLILGGLAANSHATRSKEVASKVSHNTTSPLTSSHKSSFDELLDDYEFGSKARRSTPTEKTLKESFKGLL